MSSRMEISPLPAVLELRVSSRTRLSMPVSCALRDVVQKRVQNGRFAGARAAADEDVVLRLHQPFEEFRCLLA